MVAMTEAPIATIMTEVPWSTWVGNGQVGTPGTVYTQHCILIYYTVVPVLYSSRVHILGRLADIRDIETCIVTPPGGTVCTQY